MAAAGPPSLPSVLPSEPALQDGQVYCSLGSDYAHVSGTVVTAENDIEEGRAKVTNPSEYAVFPCRSPEETNLVQDTNLHLRTSKVQQAVPFSRPCDGSPQDSSQYRRR